MPARTTNDTTNYIAFGKQTTDKDTEATTFVFLKHLDGSGFDTTPDVEQIREGGDGGEIGFHLRKSQKSSGKMSLNSRPETGGRVAAAALGADVASVVVASDAGGLPFVFHRSTMNATIPYLTIEQAAADDVERVAACKITNLDITYQAGALVQLDADFTAGGTYRGPTAAQTPTRESALPHRYHGATVIMDGSGADTCTKAKVTVKRGVDDSIQTNGLFNEDVVELTAEVMVEGTLKYEDRTLVQKVLRGGGSLVPVDLATGALLIQVSNGNASAPFKVGVPFLRYTGAKVNRLDPSGKVVFVDFTAETEKNATTTIFVESFSTATAAY
jgi:hypothetical protein